MAEGFYQSLEDLVEIFSDCSVEGEDIQCFDIMKNIVDGKWLIGNMDEELKIRMQKQLRASLEWLRSLGIETKYQQEFMGILKK